MNICSAIQNIYYPLRNPMAHYCIHINLNETLNILEYGHPTVQDTKQQFIWRNHKYKKFFLLAVDF
jgi:hypothetical protein